MILFSIVLISIIILILLRVSMSSTTGASNKSGPTPGSSFGGIVKCDNSYLTDQNIPPQDINLQWCAINFITGEKRCPSEGEDVYADISHELCSRTTKCDFPDLPYPVLPDGSTSLNGNGPDGGRCTNKPQCPKYISSVFSVDSGNIMLPPSGQYLSLGQKTTYTNLLGADQIIPPLLYEDPTQEFCQLNQSLLPYISPGTCILVPGTNGNQIDFAKCTHANPCMSGQLSYIGNPTEGVPFPEKSTFACVNSAGTCTSDMYYWYDPNTNTTGCK
jgi:hypothetical protein